MSYIARRTSRSRSAATATSGMYSLARSLDCDLTDSMLVMPRAPSAPAMTRMLLKPRTILLTDLHGRFLGMGDGGGEGGDALTRAGRLRRYRGRAGRRPRPGCPGRRAAAAAGGSRAAGSRPAGRWRQTALSSASPGWPRVLSTAGRMRSISPARWPGSSPPASAALTAPQRSCPSTITRFTPRCSTAYSMLACTSSSATLPATRSTKMSPRPWSNTTSGATRESAQVTMIGQRLLRGWRPRRGAPRPGADGWPCRRRSARCPPSGAAAPGRSTARWPRRAPPAGRWPVPRRRARWRGRRSPRRGRRPR